MAKLVILGENICLCRRESLALFDSFLRIRQVPAQGFIRMIKALNPEVLALDETAVAGLDVQAGGNALELLRFFTTCYILFVAANEWNAFLALDRGVDIAVCDNIETRELASRLEALLRRPRGDIHPLLSGVEGLDSI